MRASRLEQIVKARFGAHPPPRLWRNESAARLCAGDERIAAGFLICRPQTALAGPLAGTGPAGVPYDDSSRSCGSSSGGAHFTPIPAPADWPVEKRARWLGAGAKIGEKQPCVSASLLSAWR
jgi:hypothetical protein